MKRYWMMLCLAALGYGQTNGFMVGQGPGKLVDTLIASGYSSLSIYELPLEIQGNSNPSIEGVLTNDFLSALRACPAGSPVFVHKVDEYAGQGFVASDNCAVAPLGLLNAGSRFRSRRTFRGRAPPASFRLPVRPLWTSCTTMGRENTTAAARPRSVRVASRCLGPPTRRTGRARPSS